MNYNDKKEIEVSKDITYIPFCPICHDITENKGSLMIRVCKKCRKKLLKQLENKTYE
jgi:ribosomal protein L37AE/L43A